MNLLGYIWCFTVANAIVWQAYIRWKEYNNSSCRLSDRYKNIDFDYLNSLRKRKGHLYIFESEDFDSLIPPGTTIFREKYTFIVSSFDRVIQAEGKTLIESLKKFKFERHRHTM